MSKKQMGFTLIEIVMVLVLLGILAAVAVPKYFDLRSQAEEKAMAAVAAEVQAQVNGTFAKNILDNSIDCKTAVSNALAIIGTAESGTKGQEGYQEAVKSKITVTDDAYDIVLTSSNLTDGTAVVTITPKNNTGNAKPFTIGIPICKQ